MAYIITGIIAVFVAFVSSYWHAQKGYTFWKTFIIACIAMVAIGFMILNLFK